MDRLDIINKIIEKNNYNNYLEIGVSGGDVLTGCISKNKTGIDPDLDSFKTADENIKMLYIKSDDYFNTLDDDIKFDIIFIDGMHEAEQVFRDIRNSLKHIEKNGTIILHDCNPPEEYHTRSYEEYIKAGGYWNGNTYMGYIDAVNAFNLDYYTVDKDWGCGVIPLINTELINLNNKRKYIIPSWQFFSINRKSLLKLITETEFLAKLQ